MTDEAWQQLSAELHPDERLQLETITRDMQYLKYLPRASSSLPADKDPSAWEESDLAAIAAGSASRDRPPSVLELEEMQHTQLVVRQMPPDLRR
jgi:hypothetical protein